MKVKLILCIISGLLTGLSFNSPYLSFLIWFSLVPFIYVVSISKTKEGILGGIIFGLVYYGAVIFWISKVTFLGLVFLLIYLSLYSAVFFLVGRYWLKQPARLLTLAALWVLLEFVKENVWCGFGWANLGYSQYQSLYLIQPADLLGAKFISFVIVMFNVLIWEIVSKKKYILGKLIFVFCVLLGCFTYSFYRVNNIETTDSIKVSLVQPNIAPELKWQESAGEVIKETLLTLAKQTPRDSLIIFPEASWPFVEDILFKRIIDFVRVIERKDIFIGAILGEGDFFYNIAMLFDGPEFYWVYRKIKLVPFGEYVPLRNFLNFIDVINRLGDMNRGREWTLFSYKNKKFSAVICFEDIFPMHVWRFCKQSDFLVNITNDAWFGGNPQARQHLGIMVLRAIENRIAIVRCANTGISGWVSAKGEIETLKKDGKEVFFAGVGDFNVALNRGRSFYNRVGELFPLFCGVMLVGMIVYKQ